MILIGIVLVGIIITAIVIFFRNFLFIYVSGSSMLPTFKAGDLLLVKKIKDLSPENLTKLKSKVILIRDPETDEKALIKRVNYVSVGTDGVFFWILGDNPSVSRDSRDFGFVAATNIIGEVKLK